MDRRISLLGDSAVLVEMSCLEDVLELAAALRTHPVPGQREIVPAAAAVLIILDPGITPIDLASCQEHIQQRRLVGVAQADAETVVVDVVYDGADLEAVAELTGLGIDGVVAAHTGQVWTVAFGGFVPGFGYLVGTDDGLRVPRRRTPRTRVPAGSVGLAGEFSGVYPRESPGGWQLIGRTDAPLWRLDRDPPGLFRPGVHVRFRQVASLASPEGELPSPPPLPNPSGPGVVVESPGILSTVEDAGRPGFAALGVPRSGAADQRAYRRANRLVGNSDGSAVIETVLGGLRIRAVGAQQVVVTGTAAPVAIRSIDGTERGSTADTVVALTDGEVLKVGAPPRGLRSYLAVRGGLDVPAVLGSRSTDVLSGLGPAVLSRGMFLPVGSADQAEAGSAVSAWAGVVDDGPSSEAALQPYTQVLTVTVGPHLTYLEAAALTRLVEQGWQVTTQSNRVGIRLDGEPIGRRGDDEMPSAPLVAGAVQIPPSGHPVVFLRDHPSTGGYPVIAVLTAAAVDDAAQLRPGDTVGFRLARSDTTVVREPWPLIASGLKDRHSARSHP